jgi:dihydrofolate reductase
MVMGSKTFATIGRALPGRRTIVYTSRPEKLKVEGVEATNEPPGALIARLKKEGATAVAICGGATIYDMFLQSGVVDELCLTIVPILFGSGVPLFVHKTTAQLELVEQTELADGAVFLRYKTIKT